MFESFGRDRQCGLIVLAVLHVGRVQNGMIAIEKQKARTDVGLLVESPFTECLRENLLELTLTRDLKPPEHYSGFLCLLRFDTLLYRRDVFHHLL